MNIPDLICIFFEFSKHFLINIKLYTRNTRLFLQAKEGDLEMVII
jgi:hypothetical protein